MRARLSATNFQQKILIKELTCIKRLGCDTIVAVAVELCRIVCILAVWTVQSQLSEYTEPLTIVEDAVRLLSPPTFAILNLTGVPAS